MLKIRKVVMMLFFVVPLMATESQPSVALRDPLVQEGKLFVVKLVPGDKNLKILLVGKETVDIDWKNTDMRVTLDLGKNLKKRLKLIKKDNYFSIEDDLAKEDRYQLEVQTMHKGVSDTVRFQVDKPKKP